MTVQERARETQRDANQALVVHCVCVACEPTGQVAVCGAHLLGIQVPEDEAIDCSACAELEYAPCPRCGA